MEDKSPKYTGEMKIKDCPMCAWMHESFKDAPTAQCKHKNETTDSLQEREEKEVLLGADTGGEGDKAVMVFGYRKNGVTYITREKVFPNFKETSEVSLGRCDGCNDPNCVCKFEPLEEPKEEARKVLEEADAVLFGEHDKPIEETKQPCPLKLHDPKFMSKDIIHCRQCLRQWRITEI